MIRKTLMAAALVFVATGVSAQDATLDEVVQGV